MSSLRTLLVLSMSLLLLLAGCGKSGNETDSTTADPTANDETTNKEDQPADDPELQDPALDFGDAEDGGSFNTEDGYGFSDFDLEIDVDGKDAIDVDYKDVKPGDAEYENRLENVKLDGNDAINQMHPMFIEILLTGDTSEEEAKERILKWFKLDNYSKFDLEVKFTNGKVLKIEDQK